MKLQDQLKNDFRLARIRRDQKTVDYLRMIIGETQKFQSKEVTDGQIIIIVQGMLASQEELKQLGKPQDEAFIKLLQKYNVPPATEDEIREWIQTNIDFSQYPQRIMAMKHIVKHFEGRANGNIIRPILLSM